MLGNKETDFVNLYCNGAGLTLAEAYIRAFDEPSLDDKAAHKRGLALSKRKSVSNSIKERRAVVAMETNTSAINMVNKLLDILEDASAMDVFNKDGDLTGQKRDHRVQIECVKEINKMVGNYAATKVDVNLIPTLVYKVTPTNVIDVEAEEKQ